MRRSAFFGFSVLLATISFTSTQAATVDPELQSFRSGKKIVIVMMSAPMQTAASPHRYDSRGVVRFLKQRSQQSWQRVQPLLASQSGAIKPLRLYSVINAFAALVTPEGLRQLSAMSGVEQIIANKEIQWIDPVHVAPAQRSTGDDELPYDFKEIGLDKLMTEMPEIRGKGVKIGILDTGSSVHPLLADRFAAFYDCDTNQKSNTPKDYGSHGTHVSGTMVGKNETGFRFGVAPEAKLEVAGSQLRFTGAAQIIAGMDYMLDPDGNPSTADMPRAVNNSWRWLWDMDQDPAVEMFYKAVTAWEAAGILPVFAAGNEGPVAKTIGYPSAHPVVLTIGATGADGKIASFSSRGPGKFRGTETQKPEITAPGVNIVSSLPNNATGSMSGTSMASPHVTGAVALVLQANANLNPAQIKELLIKTADPAAIRQGQGPWNPVYGFGKLNVYAAVKKALGLARRQAGLVGSRIDLAEALFVSPTALDEKQSLAVDPRVMTEEDFDRVQ